MNVQTEQKKFEIWTEIFLTVSKRNSMLICIK